ncbi:MAG: YceI family protein [Spirochaetaceae bacterium]|nr:YceI family protein [Spirochaetaceae bacterium]
MRRKFLILFGLAVVLAAQPLFAAKFKVDHAHTNIGFSVKHMVVAKTTGSFNDFTASLELDPADMSSFTVMATIQAASIDTNNENRDNHLRSADFLDAANHPTITFVSSELSTMDGKHVLHGDLTIRGVTHAVEIPIEIVGPVMAMGNTVVGFAGSLTINRHDYGVSWSRTLDNGGLVVAEEVAIEVNGEFIMESM